MNPLPFLFSRLAGIVEAPHKLYAAALDGEYDEVGTERVEVDDESKANVVSSELADRPGMHTIVVDIDHHARLLPSSTPGNHHLYVEIPPVEWEAYERWLKASEEIGLIEPGYLGASSARKATFLRLPWTKK